MNNTSNDMLFQPTAPDEEILPKTKSNDEQERENTVNKSSTHLKPKSTSKKNQPPKVGGHYEIQKMLGQSYICRVHLTIDDRDGNLYALKSYPKKLIKSEQKLDTLRREVQILQKCRHRYIQSLREVINGESHFYIVVEFVSSILTDKVIDTHHLPENQARKYFQQLIVALRFCRKNSVVHRDLKLDKILIDIHTDSIKVTGFDVAEIQHEGELLPTCFTTFANSAPEVLLGEEYDGYSADLFSAVSSVLFPMLFGVHPFENTKKSVTFTNIENSEYSFPEGISVSEEAKDFIEKMLLPDPEQRLDFDGILEHPWFKKDFDAETEFKLERSSAGIQRAQNELQDTLELAKLSFDDEDEEENAGDDGDGDQKKKKKQVVKSNNASPSAAAFEQQQSFPTTTAAAAVSVSNNNNNLTGDDFIDKLLEKFPPNFIFASSDIEIFGSPIGAGGAGSVFKARIKSVGWDVAAKLFRERASVERAIMECEQSLKLRHRNLVQTVGLAVAKSSFSVDLVMLMELGEESLDAVLARQRKRQEDVEKTKSTSASPPLFTFAQAWSYSKQIAEGLAFLHTRFPRILHLDTKTSNVVLFQRGQVVKLCDLGISRTCTNMNILVNKNNNNNSSVISATSTATSSPDCLCANVTHAGQGTLRYCSPEQLSSTTVDARCDVYSLGATIFAMIDERWEPWRGNSVGEITRGHLVDTLRPREGCPQKLIDICRVCLAKEAKDRPADAIEVLKMFLKSEEEDSPSGISNIPEFLKEYERKLEMLQQQVTISNSAVNSQQQQQQVIPLDELLAHHSTSSSSSRFTSSNNTGNQSNNNQATNTSVVSDETQRFETSLNWTDYKPPTS